MKSALILIAVTFVMIASPVVSETLVFINVNVVPMDLPRVLANHTVVVEDGTVAKLGPTAEMTLPEKARIIDGQNGYLMPGLADMHMHLENTKAYSDPEQLLFFLAQGTTTIRSLGTARAALPWRELVEKGELTGPTLYLMGPTLVGNYQNIMGLGLIFTAWTVFRFLAPLLLGALVFVAFKRIRGRRNALIGGSVLLLVGAGLTLAEFPPIKILTPVYDAPQSYVVEKRVGPITAALDSYREQGFDGVKLYDGLTEEQFTTATAEARERGLYTTAHLLNQTPLSVQLSSGLDEVAHVDEFLSHHWIGYNLGVDPDPTYAENFSFPVDGTSIPQTVAQVAENDVAVVSNLSTDEALIGMILDLDGTLADPKFEKGRPDVVAAWRTRGRHLSVFATQGEYRRDEVQPFLAALTKALHDAGVTILVGTDSGAFQPEGSIPSDIHRELELLVEAGFSNYEALAAGTKNAGLIIQRMGRGGDVGTVAMGNRADLLLLKENPLANVSATRDRFGVMVNGRFYIQADLDRMLKEYMASREW